jgi:ATP-dependent RNA helicase DHX57
MSATVDAGLFANYFRQGLGYSPPVMTIPGFTFPVRELYLEDALELTGYKVGRNSRYASRKKATPTEDVSQSAGLVSRGISSLMGERDDWESGFDDHDDSATAANDLYSKATQQSLSVVDESIINFELIETLICSILQLELEPSAKYGFLTASDGDAERREGKALVSSSGQTQKAGAILVFLPGMMEIRRLQSHLQSSSQIAACGLGGLWVLALHGSLSGEEQKRVFLKPPSGVHKIVLATNIAKTSITIDDVV